MTRRKETPVERHQPDTWPDGSRRSTNSAFVLGYGEASFDIQALVTNERHRANSTRRVEKLRAAGTPIDSLHGISKKADAQIAEFAARRNAKRAA